MLRNNEYFCALETKLMTSEPDYYKLNVEFRRKGGKFGKVTLVKAIPI
jgi:hypothetical protein